MRRIFIFVSALIFARLNIYRCKRRVRRQWKHVLFGTWSNRQTLGSTVSRGHPGVSQQSRKLSHEGRGVSHQSCNATRGQLLMWHKCHTNLHRATGKLNTFFHSHWSVYMRWITMNVQCYRWGETVTKKRGLWRVKLSLEIDEKIKDLLWNHTWWNADETTDQTVIKQLLKSKNFICNWENIVPHSFTHWQKKPSNFIKSVIDPLPFNLKVKL